MRGLFVSKCDTHSFYILSPVGYLYGQITRLRSRLYETGFFKTQRLPCKVVSVGNLTLGGTGKTPTTMWLAGYLQSQGKKVAILSRGYKAKNRRLVSLVSDGKEVFLGAYEAGDEPFMMAKNLSGVPLLIGKKRFVAGIRIVKDFQPDVILLDDGYQHLPLARDLDLLLLRAMVPFGNGHIFPAGVLREPLTAMKRADAFILTYAEEATGSEVEKQRGFLQEKFPNKPVFVSHCEPVSFCLSNGPESIPLSRLRGRKTFAFCGIAYPESFQRMLLNLGIDLVDFKAFCDHYHYRRVDLRRMEEDARRKRAEFLVTTEKDAVKIEKVCASSVPIWILKTRFRFEYGFESFISERLGLECN